MRIFHYNDGKATPLPPVDIWSAIWEGVPEEKREEGVNDSEMWKTAWKCLGFPEYEYDTIGNNDDGYYLRLNRRTENDGPLYAVGVCWTNADGDDVVYLFDDDIALSDFMARMLPFIEKMQSKAEQEDEAYERGNFEFRLQKSGIDVSSLKRERLHRKFNAEYYGHQEVDAQTRIAQALERLAETAGGPWPSALAEVLAQNGGSGCEGLPIDTQADIGRIADALEAKNIPKPRKPKSPVQTRDETMEKAAEVIAQQVEESNV